MSVRRRFATERAKLVLANHPTAINLEGAVDPFMIAEAEGIEVHFFTIEEALSGFMLIDDGKAVLGVNCKDGEYRQRFTVAHELGHFFLHDRNQPFLDRRTAEVQILPRSEISSLGVDSREIEANIFAGELLMPEARVRQEVYQLGRLGIFDDQASEIKQLADRFCVSVRAMTIRLERLGYLDEI